VNTEALLVETQSPLGAGLIGAAEAIGGASTPSAGVV